MTRWPAPGVRAGQSGCWGCDRGSRHGTRFREPGRAGRSTVTRRSRRRLQVRLWGRSVSGDWRSAASRVRFSRTRSDTPCRFVPDRGQTARQIRRETSRRRRADRPLASGYIIPGECLLVKWSCARFLFVRSKCRFFDFFTIVRLVNRLLSSEGPGRTVPLSDRCGRHRTGAPSRPSHGAPASAAIELHPGEAAPSPWRALAARAFRPLASFVPVALWV
jgi:hypothetical protein